MRLDNERGDALASVPDMPDGWAPGRPLRQLREVHLENQVQSVVADTTTSAASDAVAYPAGAALQLTSVSATESPTKAQNKTLSEVSVSFSRDASDPNYAGARIWLTGYKGSFNPTLVAQGTDSPITFLCETTGETVLVTAQAAGANGTNAPFAGSPTTVVVLDGVVSAPPAPSISQTLVAAPLGYQFSFNQVNLGGTQDVVDSYRVYRNSANNSSTATLLRTFKHDPTAAGAIVVQDNVGGGQTYYYWVSAVNTVGLESAKTNAQSGAVSSGTASANTDVLYASGATVESLKPAEVGAQTTVDKLSAGQNAIPNASFEVTGTRSDEVASGCANWLMSTNETVSNVIFSSQDTGPSFVHSGSACQVIGINNNVTIPGSTNYYRVIYTRNELSVLPGQVWKVGGWVLTLQNHAVPAGLVVNPYIFARVWNSDASFNDYFVTGIPAQNSVYTEYNTTFTIPAAPAGASVVGMTVYCRLDITNSTGSPITDSGTGTSCHARFDTVYAIRQALLDDEVKDGSTYARTLASRLSSGKPWIDFSEAIHANKNLDNVADGTRAAWNSTTQKNAAVDSNGNLLLKNVAQSTGVTSSPTTSVNTDAQVPEMTQTITTKGNKVLVLFTINWFSPATTDMVLYTIYRDGVPISQLFKDSPPGNVVVTTHGAYIDTPSAGSHTYALYWRCLTSTYTVTANGTERTFQCVELG